MYHKIILRKDLQDTFYFNDELLLHTQTSPMQIRAMEKHKPQLDL